MKDKMICILFVIVLTFLVLGVDVQAADPATISFGLLYKEAWYSTVYDNYIGYGSDSSAMTIYLKELHMLCVYAGKSDVIWKKQTFDGTAEGDTAEYSAASIQTYPERLYYEFDKSILYNFSGADVPRMGVDIPEGSTSYHYMFDYSQFDMVFDTSDEMMQYIEQNEDSLIGENGHIVPDHGGNEENVTLPAMQYNVSRKWAPRPLTNILAYNAWIEWDYMLYELYKNNPVDYKVQLYIQKGFSYKPDSGSEILAQGEMKHVVDKSIVDNVITFSLDKTGNDLYGDSWLVAATQNNPNFYYAFVRVSSLDEKFYSKWQCFQCSKSSISNIGEVIIGDKDSLGFTHIEKVSDGDANVDDSAFHKDPNGDKTTASTDPSSALYDGDSLSFDNIVSNIKSVVACVNAVADLLSSVYSWFPQWLINIIVAGIGAVVVVGLFKLIK